MSAPQAGPRRNPRNAARVYDGKALVVVGDRNLLHVLDEVGTRIWELCDGRSEQAIADALLEEFEVEPPQALDDVRAFLTELDRLGMLEAAQPQSGGAP